MPVSSRPAVAALILACLSLAPSGVLGEAPADGMRAALAVIPQAAIPVDGPLPLQIEFGDPGPMAPVVALQSFRGTLDRPPDAAALSRILPGYMRDSTMLGRPDALEAATGLRLSDLGSILTVSRDPERVTLVTIATGAAPRMVAALSANGHETVGQGDGSLLLSRGEDFAINPTGREPANPFGGPLGQSTRFLLAEGRVVHAPATPLIEAVAAGTAPRMDAHPGLTGLLADLDDASEDAGALVRALVLLGGNRRDVLIADLVNGAEETAILVIAGADTQEAAWLADRLRDLPGGPFDLVIHDGTPASVSLRLTQPRDFSQPIWRSRPSDDMLRLLLRGDLARLLAP